MTRNRMIKPEFWSSETLSSIPLEANLFFISIWNFADDYGIIFDNARYLIGNCFPLRDEIKEAKLTLWRNYLVSKKLLIEFEYDNKKYLYVRSWEEHQTINNRSKRNFLGLEGKHSEIIAKIQTLIRPYLDTNESLTVIKKKEKEKEKEKDINTARARKDVFIPPSLQDVVAYVTEKGYPEKLGEHVFCYYNEAGWKDSKGKPVKNWKQKIIGNWLSAENKNKFSVKISEEDKKWQSL